MNTQRVADILVAVWAVSQPNRPLPQGQGVLDAALSRAVQAGAFLPEFADLAFQETPVGVYCPQLISVLDTANMSLLITTPNPTYASAHITLSTAAAIAILDEYGIPISDAKRWGDLLAKFLDHTALDPQ